MVLVGLPLDILNGCIVMGFLKSDLNHNTRMEHSPKKWGGKTAGLPATPTAIISQTVFSDLLACQTRMASIQCKYYIFNIWTVF